MAERPRQRSVRCRVTRPHTILLVLTISQRVFMRAAAGEGPEVHSTHNPQPRVTSCAASYIPNCTVECAAHPSSHVSPPIRATSEFFVGNQAYFYKIRDSSSLKLLGFLMFYLLETYKENKMKYA